MPSGIPLPPRQWACFARADFFEQHPIVAPNATLSLTPYTFDYSRNVRGESLLEFITGESIVRALSNQPLLKTSEADTSAFLSGVTQHLHYTSHAQRAHLVAISAKEFPASKRTRAVLIPIRKSNAWWNLAQDARAEFFARSATSEATPPSAKPSPGESTANCCTRAISNLAPGATIS
jgi:hypothetical protein